MILTINYTDLQNIKQQMLNDKITDNKQIYIFIQKKFIKKVKKILIIYININLIKTYQY